MEKRSALAIKVGQAVRRIRKEQNRSQELFADDCGINRTYMGNIERGEKVISIDMAKKIATNLGLTLAQFFALIEE
ncbi:hypothetical protein CCAX7_46470 [Capsulimonas corticalis]|uniref:Uncharacterized protein n=1 Tax=Capsulimonas corticalis TaxID=2219043 RepID=A0A402D4Y3_9BACT|nr:helix-turn-helix transcriptional regulator [Capsulimonas corticalis]BDI32596.1 hypothetical protein CCAX7_46470 [Capsulimonas corticalis]